MVFAVAAALVILAALALYLAAPRQQMLRRPIAGWTASVMAAVLIAIACWLLRPALAAHTLIFTLLTLLMTAWGLIPYVVAWWRHRRRPEGES